MNRRTPLMLFMVLMLSLTSVTMVQARMQMMGASTVELCADGMAVTVQVDAQGNPIYHAHHCPDCTPAMAALPVVAVAGAERPMGRAVLTPLAAAIIAAKARALDPLARGPPVLA